MTLASLGLRTVLDLQLLKGGPEVEDELMWELSIGEPIKVRMLGSTARSALGKAGLDMTHCSL